MKNVQRIVVLTGLMAVAGFATGCGQTKPAGPSPKSPAKANAESASKTKAIAQHDHSGWWCNEHGVPEEECGRCSAKVAAEFQKNGDWCKEHDRPDSQCFVCHPEKEAVFAAKYEAKLGKKPPKPEIN